MFFCSWHGTHNQYHIHRSNWPLGSEPFTMNISSLHYWLWTDLNELVRVLLYWLALWGWYHFHMGLLFCRWQHEGRMKLVLGSGGGDTWQHYMGDSSAHNIFLHFDCICFFMQLFFTVHVCIPILYRFENYISCIVKFFLSLISWRNIYRNENCIFYFPDM